jgi:predicted transposase YbfD/YdcC
MAVKGGRPGLKRRVSALPWRMAPADAEVDRRHGRRVRRTCRLLRAPALIGFPGAVQAAKVRRTRTVDGRRTWEEVFVITNHPDASYQQIASWIREHWHVENRVHWVRDVTWDEDRSQVRTGGGPRVMATLRNTALSVLRLAGVNEIARANRYLWADPLTTATLMRL